MTSPDGLSGPERPPARGRAPARLVVLLHGLGADGGDLIGLADAWAKLLPDAAFLAPDAPEPCDMAPMGRQWFSLQSHTPEALHAGVRGAAPVLARYLDAQCARFGLAESRVALVGFSQGTMMALYVALRRAQALGCVVGYSGALVGAETLDGELRARPPILLVHGDADEVVPVGALFGAVGALGAAGVAAEWHVCRGLGHGIGEDGLAIGGRFLAERLSR
jgi:phospholipase/carboxylesterase